MNDLPIPKTGRELAEMIEGLQVAYRAYAAHEAQRQQTIDRNHIRMIREAMLDSGLSRKDLQKFLKERFGFTGPELLTDPEASEVFTWAFDQYQ